MKKLLFSVMGTIALFFIVIVSSSVFAGTTGTSLTALAPNCISATDNCNQCSRIGSTGEWACTLMACMDQKTPIVYTCTKYQDNANALPATCIKGTDGCNSCFRNLITDSRACTKMACEKPGPASCTEYAKGPFAIVKEGELTNGSVSPDYQEVCLPGLATINPYDPNLMGGGVLCYDPAKGVPTCQVATKGGYPAEGRYYPNKTLLRQMDCPSKEPKFCTMEYAPVCASVQVQCIKAPCPAQLETFGNKCMMSGNPLATYLHDGECTNTDIAGLHPGEGYVYNKITSFLDNAYKVRGFGTEQMISYTKSLSEKIHNLLTVSLMKPHVLHKYEQIQRFLNIYMDMLTK